MEGMELQRRVTLSEQLAVVESFNLRDHLRVRDEDEVRPSSIVAACEKTEAATAAAEGAGGGRTLLDIIRDEEDTNEVLSEGNAGIGINWKAFKDRLRRAGAAWAASSSSVQPNRIADTELLVSVRPSSILPRSTIRSVFVRVPEPSESNPTVTDSTVAAPSTSPPDDHLPRRVGGEETTRSGESSSLGGIAEPPATAAAGDEEPVRFSLMALLEETDMQWDNGGEGFSPPRSLAAAMLVEDDDVVENETEDIGGIFYVCCVCMVRHKGAAFIPCGHTFCRLCSRELWVSRGNCPLCDNFILEILDIF
ncbi:hypothetical protein Cni_G05316 [Canna indica]|uniref:RING-type domain-containing protein n=1 Tax=Canna indica TaxID=4628 RepID=A0AAQ3Q5D2_9LILI|nr:hypothetical protein Cni_G05316 [Canna indica]